jgi:drug/metabolite transporter (DMT)-like permease
MKRFTGIALIIASSVAYGAMPIFARLAYGDGASPVTVLFLRFSIASVILLAYMVYSRTPFPQGKVLVNLILMGVFGYVGQSMAYFLAISMAPASLVALLLYLSPVLVNAGSIIVFHERLNWVKIVALVIALAGAVLTVTASGIQIGGTSSELLPGILLGIFSAVIGAAYVLAGSQVLRAAPTIPATTIIITSTAATYSVMAFAQGFSLPQHWYGYATVIALAIISTVFAIGAYMAGLRQIGPANASTLGVIEPLSAVALAALILGEAIFPEQIAGGLMIAFSVVLVSRTV